MFRSHTHRIQVSNQEKTVDFGTFGIYFPESVRPTGHRLLVAMGVASILLAALLQLDVNLKTGVENWFARQDVPLIVDITRLNVEQTSELTTEQALHKSIEDQQLLNKLAPSEIAKSEQGEMLDDSADSRVDSESVRD